MRSYEINHHTIEQKTIIKPNYVQKAPFHTNEKRNVVEKIIKGTIFYNYFKFFIINYFKYIIYCILRKTARAKSC